MSKIFYDHLVMLDDIFLEIDFLELSNREKKLLKKTIDDLFHHRLFTKILDLLPKEHHEKFLVRFHSAPHNIEHLKFLEENSQVNITSEIVILSQKIKKEVKAEIKKHKKQK